MTTYSALTAAQREQAAYLFADAILGTDPHTYEYEVCGDEVIGRSRLAQNSDERSRVRKPHTVQVNILVQEVPDSYITVEMNRNAKQAIDSFARSVVERMFQPQPQEA